ncbi:hypothetical protein [Streptomyces sp. H27-H5]|uniref:hypothetical protein n=1 Tax=Streptomyces sp. H27-H5 TaxID=2996460 RepID=UPI00226E6A88|nr:hypothetical protein [Streptomyces sp. H27-H5]MCY0957716.1 hypothetical protein [Streptomyces sp. H27-H5]
MAQATYLRTALIPLSDLTPFPGNAKRGDVDTILTSLRRNGQYRSLVARELPGAPLVVLAGNHTAQALHRHGSGDCGHQACGVCANDPAWTPAARCEVVACDEDTARRVNLIDNRSADLGSYDADALAELLSFLDEDYGGTGYQDADVERLLAPPPSLEELADTYRDPDDEDLWPVLRFTVPPEDRDLFYDLTADGPNPGDDTARFRHLLDRARAVLVPPSLSPLVHPQGSPRP